MKDVSANLLIFSSNNFHCFLVRKNEFFCSQREKKGSIFYQTAFLSRSHKKNKVYLKI